MLVSQSGDKQGLHVERHGGAAFKVFRSGGKHARARVGAYTIGCAAQRRQRLKTAESGAELVAAG